MHDSNLLIGTFLGDYKIENILFSNDELIAYSAEDMRNSIPLLVLQYSQAFIQANNKTIDISNSTHVLQTNLHPNLSTFYNMLFINDCIYIISKMPIGISLKDYLKGNKFLKEREVNNLIATLLSIFMFLSKYDLMVGSIKFDQIYLDEAGKYTIYGLLPSKKSTNYNEYYIALLGQVLTSTIILDNTSSTEYSILFQTLTNRIISNSADGQFKTIEELIPLFKVYGAKNSDMIREPIMGDTKTFKEKLLYSSLIFCTAFAVIYALFFAPDRKSVV